MEVSAVDALPVDESEGAAVDVESLPVDDEVPAATPHGFNTQTDPLATHSSRVVKSIVESEATSHNDAESVNTSSVPVSVPEQVRVALPVRKSLHKSVTGYEGVESGVVHVSSENTSTVAPSTEVAALIHRKGREGAKMGEDTHR